MPTIDPTLLGYVAAFCTTCSFIPQVVQTLRTRDTKAISLGMYSFFVFGVCLWLAYGLLVGDLPIIVANMVTLGLAATILFLKVKNTLAEKRATKPSSQSV